MTTIEHAAFVGLTALALVAIIALAAYALTTGALSLVGRWEKPTTTDPHLGREVWTVRSAVTTLGEFIVISIVIGVGMLVTLAAVGYATLYVSEVLL